MSIPMRTTSLLLSLLLLAACGGAVRDKTVALLGLTFKPNTDDMREAPSRVLMEALWDAGATVRAYDPEAMEEATRIYPDQDGLTLCDTSYAALEGASGGAGGGLEGVPAPADLRTLLDA